MTIAAVGTIFSATAKTFTLTPAHVGDFILLGVVSETTADYATSVSSSNVTWSVLVSHTTLSTYAVTHFIGEVTSASSATVTITTAAGSPTLRIAGQEFSTTAGYSALTLDTSGTVSSTTNNLPSLTPGHGAGELYWYYGFASGTATNGSTSGYTYQQDANGNPMVYDASCTSSAQAPTMSGTAAGEYGIAVLIYEAATSTPVAQADAAGAVDSMAIALTSADTAGATDKAVVTVAAPQGDAAGAVESMAIGLPAADAAGAVDVVGVSASAPQGDAAGAAEAVTASVAAPQADAAGAADSMAVVVGPATPDVAGAADTLTQAVTAPQHDVAGAVESMSFPNPIGAAAPDVAGATDKAVVAAAIPQHDVAGAVDSISVHAAVPSADVAGAVESMSFPNPISSVSADAAGAVESMSIVKGGSPTLGGTLPGIVLTQGLPAGYQGGPSGAASVPPSALGNSWEIEVRAAADYTTLLAVIPGSMLLNWQFARMLDDIGSGTVVLDQDDPWWADVTLPGGLPTETLLDDECLWQVWKDGVCRFEFLGETVTEQVTDPSEQRQVTVTGPGTIAVLKWAMIAPQGFPDIVEKLDAISDSFDEVDVNGNPVLDTNIWTITDPAANIYITPIANLYDYPGGAGYNLATMYPSGSLTIVASPDPTLLGASPYDATDTVVSAQITPIGLVGSTTDSTDPVAYGTGLDGSEVTEFYVMSNFDNANYVMMALSSGAFYAQYGGPDGNFTALLPAYDPTQHAYWMITEQGGTGGGSGTFYFWTSPDGANWTQQWQRVHYWDATNTALFFAGVYSDTSQTLQITNLNSNVTTPSYQGSIYLGEPLMGVWFDQFSAAQGRGTVPFVTTNLSETADSFGRPWTDSQNVQALNGTDMYSFLQSGASVVNADFVMNPGFQLVVGQPVAGGVSIGVDRSDYIIFRDGYDVMARQRVRARNQITTLLGGENADGHEISASSPAYIAEWGQRETWFQAAVQVDPVSMAYASAAALAQNETETVSWSFTLTPNLPGKTVFDNFDVGDWVGLERPDFSGVDKVRVVGIAVQVDNAGNETHELTFESYIQYLAEQLTYLANKLGGSFVNAQGTSPVAPSKYGIGQVPTYFTPAASMATLADVAGASIGSTMANSPMVYNPATGQYQHAGTTNPVTGELVPVTVQTPAGSATMTDVTVTVTSGNATTTVGLQGDGTVTVVDSGGSPPAIPDTPTVTGTVQGISVYWDGLLAGEPPLSNFQYVQFHVSTVSGFTPSASTLMHTQASAAGISLTGLTPGTTYYARLVAVSTAGVASAPSSQASAVAAGLPTSELTGQLPASLIGNSAGDALNPNPFFNGGSLTGWTVVNGSLSASSSPPAGAPGAAQYAAEVTSTAANCLMTGSSAPFPVAQGQPYSMTSWVYNPGGSAVSVAVGFNWAGGTSTVSVPAGSWTPLSSVQVCPSGVTSAYQVIGPVASGVTIYVLGAVAIGQIPGSLLASETVTATQIAAGTITATQIATGTITAAQIAANTITAAQILANTITAAQIAAGTITASQIQAGIILAGAINGTTVTGATFIAEGASGEIFAYAGTPAAGNLILAVAGVAGTDPYGNPYAKGVTVGSSAGNTPQVVLAPVGGAAQVQFPLYPLADYSATGNIAGSGSGGSGQLFISGPASSVAGQTDWVQLYLSTYDVEGSTGANMDSVYIDAHGSAHHYLSVGFTGIELGVVEFLYGLHPDPGGYSPTNPGVAEYWQSATLENGWTGGGGEINGVRYRQLPIGAGLIEVEGDITGGPTGNSTFCTLPAPYNGWGIFRNYPCMWNYSAASNSPSSPWICAFGDGEIQVISLQVADTEIGFHIFISWD
jgi:hypothetical protein